MGTHYSGTEQELRALNALIKLVRAAETITSRSRGVFSAVPLTESQFGVLEVLFHLGPRCQAEIGRKILKTGGNITMVIDNLEKRGFVQRQRNAEDRRYITVHLTHEGKKLIEEILPAHVEGIVREMNRLSPAEQDELGRLCKKLGQTET